MMISGEADQSRPVSLFATTAFGAALRSNEARSVNNGAWRSMRKRAFVWLLAAAFLLGAQYGSLSRELVIGTSGPVPRDRFGVPGRPVGTQAGTDLRKYIGLMTGIYPEVVTEPSSSAPAIFIGQAALRAEPSLKPALDRVPQEGVRPTALTPLPSGRGRSCVPGGGQ